MKVIFISDLHGRDFWKKAIERDSDLFICLGDYFDSFDISKDKQVENFKELLFYAKSNKKIQLLLGNHDIHYILWHTQYFEFMRGSGYSEELLYKVISLYNENKDLFKVAWQHNDILATHAGICQKYYDTYLKKFHERYTNFNIADFLNLLWDQRSGLLMKVGQKRGGKNEQGGIFWADKSELLADPLQGFTQIVGHTPIPCIEDIKKGSKLYQFTYDWKDKTRLVFTDSYLYKTYEDAEFFKIEIKDNDVS